LNVLSVFHFYLLSKRTFSQIRFLNNHVLRYLYYIPIFKFCQGLEKRIIKKWSFSTFLFFWKIKKPINIACLKTNKEGI